MCAPPRLSCSDRIGSLSACVRYKAAVDKAKLAHLGVPVCAAGSGVALQAQGEKGIDLDRMLGPSLTLRLLEVVCVLVVISLALRHPERTAGRTGPILLTFVCTTVALVATLMEDVLELLYFIYEVTWDRAKLKTQSASIAPRSLLTSARVKKLRSSALLRCALCVLSPGCEPTERPTLAARQRGTQGVFACSPSLRAQHAALVPSLGWFAAPPATRAYP